MKAAIFEAVGERLVIRDVARPVLGRDELLLKVAYTGICGSDLHAAETPGYLPAGTIMGHEFTGEVILSTSPGWSVGERVAANPLWVCEICAAGGKCHDGRDAACTKSCFMGFTPDVPGAYAEYIRIRATQAIRLPANVSLHDGALMEPLAVARHAVSLAGSVKDANVLVIGGGPIGLGVAMMANEDGARNVVVSEPDRNRRDCARLIGAQATIDPLSDNLSSAFAEICRTAPDVVFECVGAPGFLQQAIDAMAVRARVVIVGVCMTEDRIMPRVAIRKEASIKFALGYTQQDFEHVSRFLSTNAAMAAAMVSKVVGLDELPETFDKLRSQKSLIKVLVKPDS